MQTTEISCKMTIKPDRSNLEGHGRCDFRTKFVQKQRSTSGHLDEESSRPRRGANKRAKDINIC